MAKEEIEEEGGQPGREAEGRGYARMKAKRRDSEWLAKSF